MNIMARFIWVSDSIHYRDTSLTRNRYRATSLMRSAVLLGGMPLVVESSGDTTPCRVL